MNIVFIGILLVTLWNVRIETKSKRVEKYMSIESTKNISGFFVILVFLRQFGTFISYGKNDMMFKFIDEHLGQLIVAPFLFYSGYGIMKSSMEKKEYLYLLPRRFLKVLFHFDLAIFLYLILDLVIGKKIRIEKIILSFIGWKSMGNSAWYIFAMLCLYVITYLAGIISLHLVSEEKIDITC